MNWSYLVNGVGAIMRWGKADSRRGLRLAAVIGTVTRSEWLDFHTGTLSKIDTKAKWPMQDPLEILCGVGLI